MNKWDINQRKIASCCLVLSGILCFGFSSSAMRWQRIWPDIAETHAKKIYPDKRNNGGFWIATHQTLYRVDPDQTAHPILYKTILDLEQNPSNLNVIYVLTKDGVEVLNPDQTWSNKLLRRDCRDLAFAGKTIILATDQGLSVYQEAKDRWEPLSGRLTHQAFGKLASYGNVIYAATPTALYRYDASTDEYREIFSTGVSREQEGIEIPSEEQEPPLHQEILDVDVPDLGEIYVSTRHGIYHTYNDGIKWNALPTTGVSFDSLQALVIAPHTHNIWIATNQGVFQLDNNHWIKRYRGLPTNQITDATVDSAGRVYAATNRGFFTVLPQEGLSPNDTRGVSKLFEKYADVEDHFNREPTIRQVQAMAVEYADVHPDKIKRWHKQSRLKAFVPSLNAGLDRSATDLMHWDTGSNPDVLSKGKDFVDWDIGLSWDLGDVVWSSDQTSIDSRSKLMTELRQEVLDQVTRVYFERRRAQLALLSDSESGDVMEEEMRLAELTAILDGYTGGKFSQKLERHP